jgi:HAD superfamily hydrolase (TIGR01509 family)
MNIVRAYNTRAVNLVRLFVRRGDIPLLSAVVFDLYETLISEYDPEFEPGPSIGPRLGIEEDSFKRGWSQLRERRETGDIPDYPSTLREICLMADTRPDERTIQRLSEERLALDAKPFAQVDNEILAMVTHLRKQGTRLALLSNAALEETAGWEKSSLAEHFDHVVFSYHVGLMKPDPAIYAFVCERLGIPPSSAAYVGDGGDSELVGAQRAGLPPYWATWFLDHWPASTKRMETVPRNGAGQFPRLRLPPQVLAVVAPNPFTQD